MNNLTLLAEARKDGELIYPGLTKTCLSPTYCQHQATTDCDCSGTGFKVTEGQDV